MPQMLSDVPVERVVQVHVRHAAFVVHASSALGVGLPIPESPTSAWLRLTALLLMPCRPRPSSTLSPLRTGTSAPSGHITAQETFSISSLLMELPGSNELRS